MICGKWFKRQGLAIYPKNSPTIFGTITILDRPGYPHNKYGIIKNANMKGRDFIGIQIEPVSIVFRPGIVVAGFQKTASIRKYVATFYNLDGSKLVSNGTLNDDGMGAVYLTNTDTGKSIPMNYIKMYPKNAVTPSGQEQKNMPPQVASQGTGFAISSEGHIVTAYHVIKEAQTIKVYLSKDSFVIAQILHSDPMNDLAILKIEEPMSNFLKVAPIRSVKTGDRVFTIGFPMSSLLGEEAKYTEGVVSSLSGLKGAASFLQITVPVQPGNSGGALISEKGEVVGVITSTAAILPFIEESGTLPQNVNWAVKADYLKPLIELPEAKQKVLDREQLIDYVKKATFFIEASDTSEIISEKKPDGNIGRVSSQKKKCDKCGREIGKNETGCIFKTRIVCPDCFKRLSNK